MIVYNIEEATTINYVAKSIPQIHASLDNRKADRQASVVEMEGMITTMLFLFMIEPDSNLSYDSPQTTKKCKLQQVNMLNHAWYSWPLEKRGR
jgi:hypothetical protein